MPLIFKRISYKIEVDFAFLAGIVRINFKAISFIIRSVEFAKQRRRRQRAPKARNSAAGAEVSRYLSFSLRGPAIALHQRAREARELSGRVGGWMVIKRVLQFSSFFLVC